MYMERCFPEFSFPCKFTSDEVDYSIPYEERGDAEGSEYNYMCDIQEAGRATSTAFIDATWAVYTDLNINCPIKRGFKFSSTMNGLTVSGTVLGVVPGLLGVVFYIKDGDT